MSDLTDRAIAVSKLLNESTENLNRALESAEEQLRGLHIGVTARVTINEDSEVVFKKQGGKWILGIERKKQLTSWASCSRGDRICIASKLAALIENIFSAADAQLAQLESAAAAVFCVVTILETEKK